MKVNQPISLSKLIVKTQKVFNAFIRCRDAEQPCITCGRYKIEHACHFYSAGEYSALRFNENNVFGGCLQCNYYKHGNLNMYRQHVEQRIGKDKLALLDSVATRNRFKKWQRFELLEIIKIYSEKLKQAA